MSTTIPELRPVEPGVGSVSPAAAWTPTGRAAAAVALIGGGVLWLVGDLIGFGHSGVERAAYVTAHPTLTGVGVSADMLGTALLLFAIPIWLLLGRHRSPRLAWAGAVLGGLGMAAQAVIHGVDIVDYMVARSRSLDFATFRQVVDGGSGLPFAIFMIMFLGGAFLGTALTMIALWRARSLPRPALVLWIAFLAVNLASIQMPTTIIAVVALTWMAVAIVRVRATRLR
jgi:hypothetical protein